MLPCSHRARWHSRWHRRLCQAIGPSATDDLSAEDAGADAADDLLFRRGLKKDALLPGTEIEIDGYRTKDGTHRANGRNLTLPNGQTLFVGSSGTGAPEDLK